MQIFKTFAKCVSKQELRQAISQTAVMQKVSGAHWGETDKVTYIGLRLHFHVMFSKNLA